MNIRINFRVLILVFLSISTLFLFQCTPTITNEVKQNDAEAQYRLGEQKYYQAYSKQGKAKEDSYKEAAELLQKAAEQDHKLAQNRLSQMYYEGKGVPRDFKKASMWLEKSAIDSSAQDQYALGQMFRKGTGLPKDINEAYKWYTRAAEQGHSAAQYRLGRIYRDHNKYLDQKVSVKWFKLAAAQDHAAAQLYLGKAYHYGIGVTSDYEQAWKWYTVALKNGNQEAEEWMIALCLESVSTCDKMSSKDSDELADQESEIVHETESESKIERQVSFENDIDTIEKFNLAKSYYIGEGIEQNFDTAFNLFMDVAQKGHPEAQFMLAIMHLQGQGVETDYNKALNWIQKSASQGNPNAQHGMGAMYYDGLGVPQDYTEALRWFKMAADQGVAASNYLLGLMYYDGLGVTKNHFEAFKFMSKAANQGYMDAEYSLGYMYLAGEGTEENYEEAYKWIKKSATNGNIVAQHLLGNLYYGGHGVEQNYNIAVKWYKKAAEQGNEEARKRLDSLCMGSPLSNCPSIAVPEPWMAPNFILFDSSNPAYCHMIAIEDLDEFLLTNEGKENEIRNKAIPGKKFYRDHLKYLEKCQIINDYPGYDLKHVVIKILTTPDGGMFSLTWNGGIAVTMMDHRHAEEIYKQYQDDPTGYLELEKTEQAGDPIHPGNWLYALLRNYEKAVTEVKKKKR